jgi:N,N'-diacetyllegionaminate synthase
MTYSYIISEIGNNHNGDLDKALKLIAASAEAEADAVKFQSFRGIDIVTPRVRASEYKDWNVQNVEYWYQFLDSIALKLDDHQKVIDEAARLGVDFITTPTSTYIVEYLETLHGISAYKIASMDLNNFPLLEAVANTRKPVILSTGMGEMAEIRKAVDMFKGRPLTVLHCVSDYPLNPDMACLNNIGILKQQFPDLDIGFSDHSLGHELCIAARCLGAVVFEKHITLDRNDSKLAEHHFSLEPGEFRALAGWLRSIDVNLNNAEFSRSQAEKINQKKYRRSYHYNADYAKGVVVSLDKLSLLRPGDGIDSQDLLTLLGKPLTRDVNAYDPCRATDTE